MRIGIIGAGGIGATIGARLALAGHDVALLARGAHLAAVRAQGLRFVDHVGGGEHLLALAAAAEPAELAERCGPQDLLVVGLKAQDIGPMLPRLRPLLGPQTVVLPAINGLPWWYFHRAGGEHEGRSLRALDPGQTMLAALDPQRIVGCVVHLAAERRAPGCVHHTGGRRLLLGEPDRSDSARLAAIGDALRAAGFDAVAVPDIRDEIWLKLVGNLSFNPVAALTGRLMDGLCADEDALGVIRAVMREGMAVAAAWGHPVRMSVDERIALARQLGAARISMLQDLEQRRPLELEAIVGAALEMGAIKEIAMPATRLVHALLLARCRALGIAVAGNGA